MFVTLGWDYGTKTEPYMTLMDLSVEPYMTLRDLSVVHIDRSWQDTYSEVTESVRVLGGLIRCACGFGSRAGVPGR